MLDRALFYIDQSDIPADAVAYYCETAESIAGNVLYIPCQSFYLTTITIVSAPDCGVAQIEGMDTINYEDEFATILYSQKDSTSSNVNTIQIATGNITKAGVVSGIFKRTNSTVYAYSFLPVVWKATDSGTFLPTALNIDKYVRIKFTDNIVLIRNNTRLLDRPIYITTETD